MCLIKDAMEKKIQQDISLLPFEKDISFNKEK